MVDQVHCVVQRGALGLTQRFCTFVFRSSPSILLLAWLDSNSTMAHQPVEFTWEVMTKPCLRPSAPLCNDDLQPTNLAWSTGEQCIFYVAKVRSELCRRDLPFPPPRFGPVGLGGSVARGLRQRRLRYCSDASCASSKCRAGLTASQRWSLPPSCPSLADPLPATALTHIWCRRAAREGLSHAALT